MDELSLVNDYSEVIKRRTPRELKQFATPTRTRISNEDPTGYTVLEVISPDRHGLLATLGRIFMDFKIQIQNAKISTLGERVEDVFLFPPNTANNLKTPNSIKRCKNHLPDPRFKCRAGRALLTYQAITLKGPL